MLAVVETSSARALVVFKGVSMKDAGAVCTSSAVAMAPTGRCGSLTGASSARDLAVELIHSSPASRIGIRVCRLPQARQRDQSMDLVANP